MAKVKVKSKKHISYEQTSSNAREQVRPCIMYPNKVAPLQLSGSLNWEGKQNVPIRQPEDVVTAAVRKCEENGEVKSEWDTHSRRATY